MEVTRVEQCSYIKIAVLRGENAMEYHSELVKALGNNALPYHTVARSEVSIKSIAIDRWTAKTFGVTTFTKT
ncbi:hypothetical protein TNCV_1048651 [Trichonephila clavipes]|nr:hypothetical protein TNCV_1048651 [Trichonephila clavipes]